MWFGRSKNKASNRQTTGKYSINELSIGQKEDIIAMREEGMLPSDIAEEMGITADQVSKVIALEKRKLARRMGGSSPLGIDDPVQKARSELEAEKIKLETDRIKFEIEKLKADREEEFGEEGEEEENPLTIAATAFAAKLMQDKAGNNQGGGGQMPQQPSRNFDTSNSSPLVDLTEDEIDSILMQNKDQVKKYQRLPDSVILKYLAHSFPMVAEESRIRILEGIKKAKVKA